LVFSGCDYCGQSSILGLEEKKGNLTQGGNTMEAKMNFASQNLTAGQLNAIVKKLGGRDRALKFLRGELVVVIPEPTPEAPLDFFIHVDRSVKPTYSKWFKKLEHPELEFSGHNEYNLKDGVEQLLHDEQKRLTDEQNRPIEVPGNIIYKHLKDSNALASCLNLQDGFAIQQKGIVVFRNLFPVNIPFLWGSVVQFRSCNLVVPYLCMRDNKVVVLWRWLGHIWYSHFTALCFIK